MLAVNPGITPEQLQIGQLVNVPVAPDGSPTDAVLSGNICTPLI